MPHHLNLESKAKKYPSCIPEINQIKIMRNPYLIKLKIEEEILVRNRKNVKNQSQAIIIDSVSYKLNKRNRDHSSPSNN
jgi:hypothetical protein